MLEYIDFLLHLISAYKCITLHCSVVLRRSPNSLNTKIALIFLSGTGMSSGTWKIPLVENLRNSSRVKES